MSNKVQTNIYILIYIYISWSIPVTVTILIRNVPITYDDNIFTDEVDNEYLNARVGRIHKNNRPTSRTMEDDFVAESDFIKALEESISIGHYHIHYVVEKPFSD